MIIYSGSSGINFFDAADVIVKWNGISITRSVHLFKSVQKVSVQIRNHGRAERRITAQHERLKKLQWMTW
jgi:hypothetical protein